MTIELIEKIKVHDGDYLWLIEEANEKIRLNNILSKRLNSVLQLTPKSDKKRKDIVELYNVTIQRRHDILYYYNVIVSDKEQTVSTLVEEVPEDFGVDDLRFLIDKYQKNLLIEIEMK